jgi:hypothetical protein
VTEAARESVESSTIAHTTSAKTMRRVMGESWRGARGRQREKIGCDRPPTQPLEAPEAAHFPFENLGKSLPLPADARFRKT